VGSSSSPRRTPWRRGLFGLVGIAVVVLAIALSMGIASHRPAVAAGSPGALPSSPASPAAVLPTATARPPTPPSPTPEPTPVLVPAPLTGLPVTEAAARQHPIAVMVDDHADARPQAGFNAASVVWQAPAEAGVPRYMLIYQDRLPDSVGPIRSARQYFIEWAAEWNATYVHHGGSPQAKGTLRREGHGAWVWNADGLAWEDRYVFRTRSRSAPHNVFSDGAHLRELAGVVGAKDGPIEPVWSFAGDRARDRRPTAGTITLTYPYETVRYRYDPKTNRYVRSINGSPNPQVDEDDGQIVAPKNVVILRMFFGPLNDGQPAKARLEAHNIGSGEAWIATNGTTVKGTWSKASATAPTLLFGPDGSPVKLTAGQTFVQVLARTYGFDIRDGSSPTWIPPGGRIE
jgi:hypothetical protein